MMNVKSFLSSWTPRLAWIFLGGALGVFGMVVLARHYLPIFPLPIECITFEDSYELEGELPSGFMNDIAHKFLIHGILFAYIPGRPNHYDPYLGDFFDRKGDQILVTYREYKYNGRPSDIIRKYAGEIVEKKTGKPFKVNIRKECEELHTILIEGKVPERALRDNP